MQFIALTSIGIEHLLAEELAKYGLAVGKQSVGSVRFEADSSSAQRFCVMTRFSTRVMLLIDESEEINNKEQLYKFSRFQAWQDWFGPTQTFSIDFNGTNTELKNSQFSGLVIKDGIVDYFNDLYEERPSVDKNDPNIRVVAKLNKNKCALFIDYSGPRLSDRGYRTRQGKAPIREHLAAALIQRSGWLSDITQPLYDPCCGSGTLLIEAVGMANNLPSNLHKDFAFKRLPSYRKIKFDSVIAELESQVEDNNLWLIGSDLDSKIINIAEQNSQRAGTDKCIKFSVQDASELQAVAKRPGVVISNLPYGERLGSMAELVNLYRSMGSGFKKYFLNWKLALLGTDDSLFKLLKLSRDKKYKFKNGPIDVEFNLYNVTERQIAHSRESSELNYESSQSFANRLKKNKQSLKSWIKKEHINAYRLYDADIPEYNVAVDVYNDSVVIFEYAAPKEIEEHVTQKRLQDIITLTAKQLGIPSENIAVKVRKKQKGDAQYTANDKQHRYEVIEEYGAKFKVNLFDYLDTGLFLDHRLARKLIQENTQGKRFLNLFSYTGSASVHAALGGAKAITTVDMSKTYLKWAEENFTINNLKNTRFRFEQADCLKWLEHATGHYDVIFLDPPTFSNSKRMKHAFDVQRDHMQLMEWVKKILSPSGMLIFSNNKRGFEMDEIALAGLALKADNISEKTLSPDFKRNKKIHNCWMITHA